MWFYFIGHTIQSVRKTFSATSVLLCKYPNACHNFQMICARDSFWRKNLNVMPLGQRMHFSSSLMLSKHSENRRLVLIYDFHEFN